MEVKVKDNTLIIKIELQKPTISASGRALVVATSRGNQTTTAMLNGQRITIGLNAYIRRLKKSQALALGIPINSTMTD